MNILEPLRRVVDLRPTRPDDVAALAATIKRKDLIDADGQPGPYLRWLCLLNVVCRRWRDHPNAKGERWLVADDPPCARDPDPRQLQDRLWDAYLRRTNSASRDRRPQDWLRGAFHHSVDTNLWPASSYLDRERELYVALETVWNEIRAQDGLRPSSLDELANVPVVMAGDTLGAALDRLTCWISSDDQRTCDDLSRLRADHFVYSPRSELGQGDDRWRQLSRLEDLLTRADRGDAPLVNVWSTNDSMGLTAFATEMCCRLAQRFAERSAARRPSLLYMPLHRLLDGGCSRRVNRRDVVSFLAAALGSGDAPPAPQAVDVTADEIERLQYGLTVQRVVLVLDGASVSSPPFAAIWDLIRNTEWVPFLRTLIQASDEGLARTGGAYRSRVLVTSNRPLEGLEAWLATPAEKLPSLRGWDAARSLIDDRDASRERDKLGKRLETLWPASSMRPRINDEPVSRLYRPPQSMTARDVLGTALETLPDERDLTLIRCALELRRTPGDNLVESGVLGDWLAHRSAGPADRGGRVDRATLVIQVLAVSTTGLRVDTLRRCIDRLAARQTPDFEPPLVEVLRGLLRDPAWIEAFVDAYRFVIEASRDADRLALPARQARFELEGSHDAPAPDLDAVDHYLDIRNEGIREAIVSDLLSSEAGVRRFRAMHEVLAEEALAQASARSRRSGTGAYLEPIVLRRYVQTIYHGLLSLDIDELEEHDPRPEWQPLSISGHALPAGTYRRYVYLYEFVYRRILEQAPDWMLGRGLGREDLRVALLAMFANPGWARRVIGMLPARAHEARGFQSFGAFADTAVRTFGRPLHPISVHLRGALGTDLFNALLHACLRGGRQRRFAQKADLVAAQLAVVRGGEPPRGTRTGTIRREFAKIAIDALQTTDALGDVEARCIDELATIGGMPAYPELVVLGRHLRASGWSKTAFESDALVPMVKKIGAARADDLEYASDILFRVGELIATRADLDDDAADLDASLERYANAYAVFWLADRVRAAAATLDQDSVRWPMVSARAMRYFVRVALKTAKLTALVAHEAPAGARKRLEVDASKFYAQARARIDVYSRHMTRYPLERVHSLLLLAAAARIRAAMVAALSPPGNAAARVCKDLLETSRDYLREARDHTQALEVNPTTHKRFLLERIKTNRKLASLDGNPLAAALASRDLHTLGQLARGSVFWRRLLERLGRAEAGREPSAQG